MSTVFTIEKDKDLYLFNLTIKDEESESSISFSLTKEIYAKLNIWLNSDINTGQMFEVVNGQVSIDVVGDYIHINTYSYNRDIDPESFFKFKKQLCEEKMNLLKNGIFDNIYFCFNFLWNFIKKINITNGD